MAKSAKQAQSTGGRKNQAGQQASGATTSAIELLKQDHRKVESLFEEFEQSSDNDHKQDLVEQICSELNIHSLLEEEIFYRVCREGGVEDDKMDESQVEHDTVKLFVNDLMHGQSSERYWEAKVKALKELVEHHVEEEEKPGTGVFAQAKAHNIDSQDLASRIMRRKQELQERHAGMRPAHIVSLDVEAHSAGMGGGMGRYGGMERDERGRFMREDEDYGRYGGGSGSRRGWYGESRGGRGHDEDDDRYYARSSGGDYRGWYGDPRGHAEASRRGWEERRGSRYEEDYGRRHSRSRDDDHGGWYGDPRGHAEASRRGWQHRR